MSGRRIERALERMAASGCMLAPERSGERYSVYANDDRRRRPMVRLHVADVRALEADGSIVKSGDGYTISEPGRARVARDSAAPGEAFLAQHGPLVDRAVIAGNGALRRARGYDADALLRRLSRLRGGAGEPWLSNAEIAAAARLRSDWEMGERGLVRGSDWTAPPNATCARSVSNGMERAATAFCDARQRVADALAKLAPPLRRVVERVCLLEDGLEALERGEAWPTRSGKLALKLALAQLAAGEASAA